MDFLSSPLVKKIVGEISSNQKRQSSAPNEVCLGDWWLSKPDDGVGVSVSGYPFEMRRCHNTRQCNSVSVKKRYAMRVFDSKRIVKRHDCTRVESSDGLMVYLCGFINRSLTKQNGFSSEVCRDFIYGFPLNWEASAAQQRAVDQPTNSDHESFSEHSLTTALDSCNGAQLHDLVLSLTDTERDMFTKKMSNNLLEMLNPDLINTSHIQPSKSNPSSPIDTDIMTPKSCIMTKGLNSMEGLKKRRKVVEEKSSSGNDLDPNDNKPILERGDQKHSVKHEILSHKCSTLMKGMISRVGENGGSSDRQASRVRRSRRLEGKTPFLEGLNVCDEKVNIKHDKLHVEVKRLF